MAEEGGGQDRAGQGRPVTAHSRLIPGDNQHVLVEFCKRKT